MKVNENCCSGSDIIGIVNFNVFFEYKFFVFE